MIEVEVGGGEGREVQEISLERGKMRVIPYEIDGRNIFRCERYCKIYYESCREKESLVSEKEEGKNERSSQFDEKMHRGRGGEGRFIKSVALKSLSWPPPSLPPSTTHI